MEYRRDGYFEASERTIIEGTDAVCYNCGCVATPKYNDEDEVLLEFKLKKE